MVVTAQLSRTGVTGPTLAGEFGRRSFQPRPPGRTLPLMTRSALGPDSITSRVQNDEADRLIPRPARGEAGVVPPAEGSRARPVGPHPRPGSGASWWAVIAA